MFHYSIQEQKENWHKCVKEWIHTLPGFILRFSYNGKQDESDYYGISFHKTHKGAMIALANRKRASKQFN
jgi:hypothetical protein